VTDVSLDPLVGRGSTLSPADTQQALVSPLPERRDLAESFNDAF
jgi:hypothetical protein